MARSAPFRLLMLLCMCAVAWHAQPCRCDPAEDALRDEALAQLPKTPEKMKPSELRKLLDERGVECTACAEKADLVSRVRETIHMPVIAGDGSAGSDEPAGGTAGGGGPGGGNMDPELQRILNELKSAPGLQNMKLFDKEQMAAFADKIKNKEKERKEDL